MGAYLSSPVTDKISCDKSCTGFTYGASSMQGWRISQEDAHNCIPELDSNTAMFAVYDGHGGCEVAQYCSKFLPDCIKDTEEYKEGQLGPALVDAFLKFDSTLVQDEIIKELKLLAGVDENDEEEDDDDPVGRGEADDLRAEADLPLDELLAKYQTPLGGQRLHKKENVQSPVVKAKKSQCEDEAGPSSSTDTASNSSRSNSTASGSSCAHLTNGLADNENNVNKERELQDTVTSESANPKDGGGDPGPASVSQNSSSDKTSSSKKSPVGGDGFGDSEKSVVSVADSSSGSGDAGGTGGCSSSSAGGCDVGSTTCSSGQSPSKVSNLPSDGVSSSTSCVEGEQASGSSSKIGSTSGGSSKAGKNESQSQKANEDLDDDDDSDEDDEDEWQDLSGEEEEDDEEDEGMDEADEPVMDMSNEEPGSDSGCTACVALLRGEQLVVANAGDSRCVLCRGGTAVDLSVDHKPEDPVERSRIEKAGGKVTADGRVNGGLNLSRAIGDHFYKRKEDLPPEEQMITALPDIQTVAVGPQDQFLVLACDGIWNSMSSQECVDFVAERLKDPMKRSKPSLICEELFDHCLATNTYGDGTGCDNMTCIIVVLHPSDQSEADGNGLVPSKRCVGDLEVAEENWEKRPRVEDGDGGGASAEVKQSAE